MAGLLVGNQIAHSQHGQRLARHRHGRSPSPPLVVLVELLESVQDQTVRVPLHIQEQVDRLRIAELLHVFAKLGLAHLRKDIPDLRKTCTK